MADLPLATLTEPVVPYETDEVTRLIVDTHDYTAFAPVAALTVGAIPRIPLAADGETLTALSPGVTPEMAAAVSKLMRLQDLIAVAADACHSVPQHHRSARPPVRAPAARTIPPMIPTASPRLRLDGLLLGVLGRCCHRRQPFADSVDDDHHAAWGPCSIPLRDRYAIPTQSCVLWPMSPPTLRAIESVVRPIDLVFQSIAGTEAANHQSRHHADRS